MKLEVNFTNGPLVTGRANNGDAKLYHQSGELFASFSYDRGNEAQSIAHILVGSGADFVLGTSEGNPIFMYDYGEWGEW